MPSTSSCGRGNDVDGDDLANLARRRRAGVGRGFDRADVAANHDRDEAAADLLPANEPHVCSLDHGVGGFDGADESFRFDQSQSAPWGACGSRIVSHIRLLSMEV